MVSARIISGGYKDAWLSCDAHLMLNDIDGSVIFTFYLPKGTGEVDLKQVALTDGTTIRYAILYRGKQTTVDFGPVNNKNPVIRVLCAYPEIAVPSDARQLGMLLASISTVNGSTNLLESCRDLPDLPDLPDPPSLPDFWAVHDALDVEFYHRHMGDRPLAHDPVTHYLAFGWRDNLEPNATFDSAFYRRQLKPEMKLMVPPFVHFLTEGRMLGLKGHAGAKHTPLGENLRHEVYHDLAFTEKVIELLKAIGVDVSFLSKGKLSRYTGKLFDAESYRISYGLSPTLTRQELFTRYVLFDYPRGVTPGPLFNEPFYKAALARDGRSTGYNETGFRDWTGRGVTNGIPPTPLFDAEEYLLLNPDLKSYPHWLFEHWLMHGIVEGRQFDRNLRIARNRAWESTTVEPRVLGVESFVRTAVRDTRMIDVILEMRRFRKSDLFIELCIQASKIDPNVGSMDVNILSLVPPIHDEDFATFVTLTEELPADGCDAVVLMPFCKLGGADFVAGVVTATLVELGFCPMVLRTDLSDWERPDWFPTGVSTVDISAQLSLFPPHVRSRALYETIRHLRPKVVVNVNSRLAFNTFEIFGARLKLFTNLYCYYFCSDLTADGQETGYPVWYFAPLLPYLAGVFLDTRFLSDTLIRRHALGAGQAKKLEVLYTPAMYPAVDVVLAEVQVARAHLRERPCILWAGRFDRQKRFDLVIKIAQAMPDIDFRCWGKAILDAAPDLSDSPANLEINGPFTHYGDLPLNDCDGWLYTASWDGMPTILIEIAQMGMPVVASAVGGIPELVDETTGWPISPGAAVNDYTIALREMLADPALRERKGRALRARVEHRHSRDHYRERLGNILGAETEHHD